MPVGPFIRMGCSLPVGEPLEVDQVGVQGAGGLGVVQAAWEHGLSSISRAHAGFPWHSSNPPPSSLMQIRVLSWVPSPQCTLQSPQELHGDQWASTRGVTT